MNVIMTDSVLGKAVVVVYVHCNDGDDDMREIEASYKILAFIVCLMGCVYS